MALNQAVSVCTQLTDNFYIEYNCSVTVVPITVNPAFCLQMALNPAVSVNTQLTDKLYIKYTFSVTVYK